MHSSAIVVMYPAMVVGGNQFKLGWQAKSIAGIIFVNILVLKLPANLAGKLTLSNSNCNL